MVCGRGNTEQGRLVTGLFPDNIPALWHHPKFFYSANPLLSMTTPRYWIIVASQEHVNLGVAGGFAQAGHGKKYGLARMHAGDRIVYYSPKITFDGNEPLHAFTALGEVADEEIVRVGMSPDFKPFRRNVKYQYTGVVMIGPLIRDLQFIRNKKSWGYAFRFGLLEIRQPDFERIETAFRARE
jgi:hypothetical protein